MLQNQERIMVLKSGTRKPRKYQANEYWVKSMSRDYFTSQVIGQSDAGKENLHSKL